MADPLSVAAGIIGIITATIQTTSALNRTIESFKSYPKRVAELKSQVLALSVVLSSLRELAKQDTHSLSLLEAPLRECCIACRDFMALLEDCRSSSRSGALSVSEWLKLTFRNGDVVSFSESLAMYKSTIAIAVADANLRTSKVTLEVLNEYKGEVDAITQRLQSHFDEVLGRLDGLATTTGHQRTSTDVQLDQIKAEKSSIETCLRICRQFQADIDKMQFQLASGRLPADTGSSLAPTPAQENSLASSTTLASLTACGVEIADAILKLSQQQMKAQQRALAESTVQRPSEAETHAEDVQKLQSELDGVSHLMTFCQGASSRATAARVHIVNDIAVGDNSQQLCVSTIGDLFKVRGAVAGHGSLQMIGSIGPEPLQEIVRIHSQQRTGSSKEDAGYGKVLSVSSDRGSRLL